MPYTAQTFAPNEASSARLSEAVGVEALRVQVRVPVLAPHAEPAAQETGAAVTSDTAYRVLDYLRSHIAQHGLAPTRVEIARVVGLTPTAIDHHLRKLSSLGVIELTEETSRNIRLVQM